MGALAKYRVLDLSRILAGPWASQLLADLGAQVIKIERPKVGDDTRTWGPPFVDDKTVRPSAAYFHGVNRNKQSVAIDIARPEGQALVKQLAMQCDVVIENFKVGGLKKYGLDYASLQAMKPDLIYCSITGFGQTGPYKGRAGYDFMIQAMGGMMSVTGNADGMPTKIGVAMADVTTGLYAANAVQAALLHREATGEGQMIDLGLLDVQVATLANQAMNYLASGVSPSRLGNAHPNIVPYEAFKTQDGFIILAVGNDKQFVAFCTLAKQEQWAEDTRFVSNQARVENRAELVPLVQATMLQYSSDWWLEHLNKYGVPCGPINTIEQVFNDPQVKHRKMQVALPASHGESVDAVANPIKFSQTPVRYEHASPQLGEHTQSCLHSLLGIDEAQFADLQEQGVVDMECN